MICASSEDFDQPGHPPSLIRVFAVRMKKPWVLSYPLSTQWRLIRLGGCPGWSESLLGSHHFVGFVMLHLMLGWSSTSLDGCLLLVTGFFICDTTLLVLSVEDRGPNYSEFTCRLTTFTLMVQVFRLDFLQQLWDGLDPVIVMSIIDWKMGLYVQTYL